MADKWTKDEIMLLKECDRLGLKPSEIAPKLGRTANAVTVRMYLLRAESGGGSGGKLIPDYKNETVVFGG